MRMPIFQWSMARLVVENGYPKDMCNDESGLCVTYKDIVPCTMMITFGRVFCDPFTRTFTLASWNFCISSLILTLEWQCSWFTIANLTVELRSCSTTDSVHVELEVSIIGMHTLVTAKIVVRLFILIHFIEWILESMGLAREANPSSPPPTHTHTQPLSFQHQ